MPKKYLFKRTAQKKGVKGREIGTQKRMPDWLKNGQVFIYKYEKKYKPTILKTMFKIWRNKAGKYYIDVDNVYPTVGEETEMRVDDVLPLKSNLPMDFFIRPNPDILDPWYIMKKNGFENLGKEEVRIPLGVFSCNAFYKMGPEPCICKTQNSRAGICQVCAGSGKDGLMDCKQCSGTGKCKECKGRGELVYQTKIWYEPVTGIKLRTERKLEQETIMVEYLAAIKPINILAKLSIIA